MIGEKVFPASTVLALEPTRWSDFFWKNVLFIGLAANKIAHMPSPTDPAYFPYRHEVPFGPFLGNFSVSAYTAVGVVIAAEVIKKYRWDTRSHFVKFVTKHSDTLALLGVGVMNVVQERDWYRDIKFAAENLADASIGLGGALLGVHVVRQAVDDFTDPRVRFE